MHSSLEEVMEFYEDISEGDDDDGNNGVINSNVSPNQIDPLATQLEMDDDVTNEIIAFMEALNDPNLIKRFNAVPSGLPVGGETLIINLLR